MGGKRGKHDTAVITIQAAEKDKMANSDYIALNTVRVPGMAEGVGLPHSSYLYLTLYRKGDCYIVPYTHSR